MIKEVSLRSGVVSYRDNEVKGPSIILLHGTCLSSEIFIEQYSGILADKYRVIALDLPGHGSSSRPNNPEEVYSVTGFASLVSEFISALDLDSVVLAGVSLGGNVAIEATTMCDDLKGLLLFSVAPIGDPFAPDKAYKLKPEELGVAFAEEVTGEQAAAFTTTVMQREGDPIWERAKKDMLASDSLMRTSLGGSLMSGKYLNEVDIVSKLEIPVAILHGDRDEVVQRGYIDDLDVPTLWRGSVQDITGGGHMPQLDNPELFNKLVDEFISHIS